MPPQHQQSRRQDFPLRLAFADIETFRLGLDTINVFTKETMADNFVFYQRRGYGETGRCDDDGFCRVFISKSIRRKAARQTGLVRNPLSIQVFQAVAKLCLYC